jgi:hypothetical protein
MRDIVIFLKEIEFRKCRDVILSFKKSTVNENRFQMLVIEFIVVKIMILRQLKKKHFFENVNSMY